MQEQRYEELNERASEVLEVTNQLLGKVIRKAEAKAAITAQLEAMKQEDKILMLDEDEERMLRAFRNFRLRAKPGDLFKWKAAKLSDPKVGIYKDTGFIHDPLEG